MPSAASIKTAAKWLAAWVVSNLVWTLVSAASGLIVSGVLRAAGVFSNPYLLIGIALLVAALMVAILPRLWHRDTAQGLGPMGGLSSGTPPQRGWVDPEELGRYLERINRTMDQHGFGRNPAASSEDSLDAWLGERQHQIRRLAARLREKIASDGEFDARACRAMESSFWNVNDEVLRKLHVEAPGWGDYFTENPSDVALQVTPIAPEQFEERARFMDLTAGQIDQIRDGLRNDKERP